LGSRAFWLDLEKALRAWGAAPALPIASTVLVLLTEVSSIAESGLRSAVPNVPWFAILTFISFPLLLFWAGRHVVLGVIVGTPSRLPRWTTGVFLAYWFVADVVLRFVTPALAHTTRRVRDAIAIGWSMLRSTWPRFAIYALLPPLTLTAFATYNPSSVSPFAVLVITIASTLLGLLTKGAIASFYIDHGPGVVDPMVMSQTNNAMNGAN
jgi:hypothetical protein